ncbi:cupin domain-containing protein [Streptomyces sp. NBC_01408]|uniref:cupin domain-containing protein n=1 Tax=Streptomyces sp. NBC_01408 TaxID=2903855 RepID=UPI00225B4598|nr:cupin domain-containing protein [Streptomyces sp. NBC_01408]MCX4691405.1 cupin domain-containing protein [Streptomyces sp. NBC_01408]
MAGLVSKNFDKPDETRPFEDGKGRLDLVETGGGSVGRAVFEPGWKWSEHIKPLAGTDSCESAHTGYVVSGHMKVVMNDGDSAEIGPGDFIQIAPGHDAWVLGDERCVVLDWTGYDTYAKPVSG